MEEGGGKEPQEKEVKRWVVRSGSFVGGGGEDGDVSVHHAMIQLLG